MWMCVVRASSISGAQGMPKELEQPTEAAVTSRWKKGETGANEASQKKGKNKLNEHERAPRTS